MDRGLAAWIRQEAIKDTRKRARLLQNGFQFFKRPKANRRLSVGYKNIRLSRWDY